MTIRGWKTAAVVLCLLSMAVPALAVDEATLFRVFLRDGTTLVSYGEVAQVGDHVVFSMPTSASASAPALQLVNIPSDRVDWAKTARYAESARASQYLGSQASHDYALLSSAIADALNDIGQTDDPVRRLAIVERARKTLATWPSEHYGYKQDEVRQMLGVLDEAIADLRSRTGANKFNLSFVASATPAPVLEPLLPPPTPKEAIEQTLRAARLTDSPVERVSLLTMVSTGLDRDARVLPPEWRASTIAAARAAIAMEVETDRQYDGLTRRILSTAKLRARSADVRGLQRLLTQIHGEDVALGSKRHDTITALVDSVQLQLDGARRLQLERDRWQLRLVDFKVYNAAIEAPLARLNGLRPSLENIKTLAGSGPAALGLILKEASLALKAFAAITPPDEFRPAHALLMSASQLADSAARTRREAALTGDLARAWDASSAAAGALMLTDRAREDIAALLKVPQLSP